MDSQLIEREVNYSMHKIRLAPSNESPWSYVYGLLKRYAPGQVVSKLLGLLDALINDSEVGELVRKSPSYWKCLVDVYEIQAKDVPEKRAELETVVFDVS